MKLIIGGAYQGKKQYALENYKEEILVSNFHLIVLDLIKNNVDAINYIKQNLNLYKDKVVICDDISCGVVPTDKIMRKWREDLGHILAIIAKESDEVIRVFCGIGMRLK